MYTKPKLRCISQHIPFYECSLAAVETVVAAQLRPPKIPMVAETCFANDANKLTDDDGDDVRMAPDCDSLNCNLN